jgi:16S rRNA (cytosine1402-N4)-methyltransferase
MVEEVLAFLRCQTLADKNSHLYKPDAVFVDGTLGSGGHTLAILKAHPTCRVVAFDRDGESQKIALERLRTEGVEERVTMVQGDFRNARTLLQPFFENLKVGTDKRPINSVDGALVDAGMSLMQVTWPERGLSFRDDGPLDMRYNRTSGPTAADLVNRLSPTELEDLFFHLTDERWARRIATFIAEHRRTTSIRTTSELARIVENAIPASVRRSSRVHPATKTFAALRIAVNDEFWALDDGALTLSSVLQPSARLVILTYSSNEDRTLKRTFRRLSGREEEGSDGFNLSRTKPRRSADFSSRQNGTAARSSFAQLFPLRENFNRNPLELPFKQEVSGQNSENPVHVGSYGLGETWKMSIVTRKPVEPSEAEVAKNPLARSCKLRAAEKVLLEAPQGD